MNSMQEITRKNVNELQKELSHLREDLRELNFQISQNQHKDVRDVREKRKMIARFLTAMKTKEKEDRAKAKQS